MASVLLKLPEKGPVTSIDKHGPSRSTTKTFVVLNGGAPATGRASTKLPQTLQQLLDSKNKDLVAALEVSSANTVQ